MPACLPAMAIQKEQKELLCAALKRKRTSSYQECCIF
jgi:hypothetical protein